jgi:hypothetical protein
LPSFFACWPSHVGVHSLPGRLPNSARRDAGRLVDVERLPLFQLQVAVAHGLLDQGSQRRGERGIRLLADDQHEGVDVDLGKPGHRCDLRSEVHNSRAEKKSRRCYSIRPCAESSRRTSARPSSSS